MAKGESRYNPLERKVERFEFTVLPTNDYTLQSRANARVQCSQEPGQLNIPYVSVQFNALGTAKEEGKKDASFWKNFFLSTTPSAEDKKPAIDFGGGITELCQILNIAPEGVEEKTFQFTHDDGEVESRNALDAAQVRDWINGLGEFVIKAHVQKKPASGGYGPKNEVSYWIPDEVNTSFNTKKKK